VRAITSKIAEVSALGILIDEWRAAHSRHGWAVGATLLCRITFISFVVQNVMARVYLNLPGF
jgi:hypothetical protein